MVLAAALILQASAVLAIACSGRGCETDLTSCVSQVALLAQNFDELFVERDLPLSIQVVQEGLLAAVEDRRRAALVPLVHVVHVLPSLGLTRGLHAHGAIADGKLMPSTWWVAHRSITRLTMRLPWLPIRSQLLALRVHGCGLAVVVLGVARLAVVVGVIVREVRLAEVQAAGAAAVVREAGEERLLGEWHLRLRLAVRTAVGIVCGSPSVMLLVRDSLLEVCHL